MNPIDRFLFWLHRKRCADCKEWWDFQKFTVPANDEATRHLRWVNDEQQCDADVVAKYEDHSTN